MKAIVFDKGSALDIIDVQIQNVSLPKEEDLEVLKGSPVLGKVSFYTGNVKKEGLKLGYENHLVIYNANMRDFEWVRVDESSFGVRPMLEADGLSGQKNFTHIQLQANGDVDCTVVNGKLLCNNIIGSTRYRKNVEYDRSLGLWQDKLTGKIIPDRDLISYENSEVKAVIDKWAVEKGIFDIEQERWTPDQPEMYLTPGGTSILADAVASVDATPFEPASRLSDRDILGGLYSAKQTGIGKDDGPKLE